MTALNAIKNEEKTGYSYIADENVKCTVTSENNLVVSYKTKIHS